MIRSILKAGAALSVIAGITLAGITDADAKTRWKMASAYPGKLTQLGSLGIELADKLTKVSGGELEVRFYEPGALVPALEMYDAISKGSLDAAWSTPGYWVNKNITYALFAAVPFGPSAGEYAAWMFHGGGEDQLNEIYNRDNIHAKICGIIAPEASGWFREEIKSLDQLKGLKMRFFGLGAKVMEKMGVSTQLLAGGDIYPALERGTIDATEFSQPAIDLNLGFYQIAKHYYFPGWHQQSTTFDLMMHKPNWDELNETQQAQIEITCGHNFTAGFAEGEAIQGKALIELKEKGVIIHRWPDEILDQLEAAWEEVAAEIAAENEDFKRVWANLQEFRAEYAVWRELGYLR
ncbi:MAG: TRAP transporter substrate-binding protein [Alphaproteobacteria bacterium]|nr:TRAP transporter substrate-binding protein [Alphaproteobacteria bacterium]